MNVVLWSAIVLVLIPVLLAGLGGYLRAKELGTFDNAYPREQYAAMTGVGARTWAAQQNAWEALLVFVAAVGAAHIAGVDPADMASASLVVVGARIAHAVFYIGGQASLRSISFVVSLLACLSLFRLALSA